MKRVDQYIFKKVDEIQSWPQFQQLIGKLEALPSEQVKYVKQAISYALAATPLLVLLMVFAYTSNIRSQFDLISSIKNKLEQIDRENKKISMIEKSMINKRIVSNKNGFEEIIKEITLNKGMDLSKLRVERFDRGTVKNRLKRATARLSFEKFSSKEFGDLIHAVVVERKMKIKRLETSLVSGSSQIKGTMELLYFNGK